MTSFQLCSACRSPGCLGRFNGESESGGKGFSRRPVQPEGATQGEPGVALRGSWGRLTAIALRAAAAQSHEGRPLAHRPTTEELALHILKRVYEGTEGRSGWRTLAMNKTGEAAMELAVDRGWLLVHGSNGACLMEEGRARVRRGLS